MAISNPYLTRDQLKGFDDKIYFKSEIFNSQVATTAGENLGATEIGENRLDIVDQGGMKENYQFP